MMCNLLIYNYFQFNMKSILSTQHFTLQTTSALLFRVLDILYDVCIFFNGFSTTSLPSHFLSWNFLQIVFEKSSPIRKSFVLGQGTQQHTTPVCLNAFPIGNRIFFQLFDERLWLAFHTTYSLMASFCKSIEKVLEVFFSPQFVYISRNRDSGFHSF
uniref:Uncharacterized protein n=1 Tax=Cacopsylla melanoneura TaxID=428564 RepID=A0A8D8TSR0_9HEMI